MKIATSVLLCLSLVAVAVGQQHVINTGHKEHEGHKYNVTLNFDDLPTNTHGIGFHPVDPHSPALAYKSLYMQSFTLLNTSSAANLGALDKTCAKSQPNAVFASRKPDFAWPRISLYDLSKPASELEPGTSRGTFGLVSLWFRPTGKLPGPRASVLNMMSITLVRVHPDGAADGGAGFPDVFRGEPSVTGKFSTISVVSPGGLALPGLQLNVRRLFGAKYGVGVDVMEITSQNFRFDKETRTWSVAEDWEICLDDIVLEMLEDASDEEESTEYGAKMLVVGPDGLREFEGGLEDAMEVVANQVY